jgi:imidazole glycerol-phosphate synthase subunit HisH
LIPTVKKVAIVDYGLGNRQSIAEAIRKVGHDPLITRDFAELEAADNIILPGVGAFGLGMENLASSGLIPLLERLVLQERKPFLGICLGFQLLARTSEEFGAHYGLGWLDASVRRLRPQSGDLKVPHVGWDETKITTESMVWQGIPDNAHFYYVHGYHVECVDASSVLSTFNYGRSIVSAVKKGNIIGTQFHPEKSQQHGLTLLKNFIEKTEWLEQD